MVPNISHGRPLLAEFRLALSTEDPGTLGLPGQVLGLPSLGILALRAVGDRILPLGVSIVLSSLRKMSYLCGWGVVCTVGLLQCEDSHFWHVRHTPRHPGGPIPAHLSSLPGSLQPSTPLLILHLSSLSFP